jgi:ribosomal protein L32
MILKYLIIALILYAAWRVVRRDFRRKFAARPQPHALSAIDTVKCPQCGLYLPQGLEKNCGLPDCPYHIDPDRQPR